MPVSDRETSISGANSAVEDNASSESEEIQRFGDEKSDKRKKKKKKKSKKKRKEKKRKKRRGEDSNHSSPNLDEHDRRDSDRWSDRVQTSGRRKNKEKEKRSRSPRRNERRRSDSVDKISSSRNKGGNSRRGVDIGRDLRIHRDRSPTENKNRNSSNNGNSNSSSNSKRFDLKKPNGSPNHKNERNRRSLSEDRDYRIPPTRKNSVNKNNKNKPRVPFENTYSASGPSDENHSLKRKHDNFVEGRAPKRRKLSDEGGRRKPVEPRHHAEYNSGSYGSTNSDSVEGNYDRRGGPVTQSERSRRAPAIVESERRDRGQNSHALHEGMPIQDNSRIREIKRNPTRQRGRERQRSPPRKRNRDRRNRSESPQFQFRGPQRTNSPPKNNRRNSPARERSPPANRNRDRKRKADRGRERGRSPPSGKRNRRRDRSPRRERDRDVREKDRSPRRKRSRRNRSPSSSRSRSRGRRNRDRRKRRSRSRSSSYSRRRSRRKSKKKKSKVPQWLTLAVQTFAMEHPQNPQILDFNTAFCKLIVKQFPELIKHAPFQPHIYSQLKLMYNEFYKCRFQATNQAVPFLLQNPVAGVAAQVQHKPLDAFSTLGLMNPADILKQQTQVIPVERKADKKPSRSGSGSSSDTGHDDKYSSESSSDESETSAREQKSEKKNVESKKEAKPVPEPSSNPSLTNPNNTVQKEINPSNSSSLPPMNDINSINTTNGDNNKNMVIEDLTKTTPTNSPSDATTAPNLPSTSSSIIKSDKVESMDIDPEPKSEKNNSPKNTADARTQQLFQIVNSSPESTTSNNKKNSPQQQNSKNSSYSLTTPISNPPKGLNKTIKPLNIKPPSMTSEDSEFSTDSSNKNKLNSSKASQGPEPRSPAGLLIGKVQSLLNNNKQSSRQPQSKPQKSRKPVAREYVDIVSYEKRAEDREKSQTRLLSKKKLMLFLDIDHTLLHASRNPKAKAFLKHPQLKKTIHQIEFENTHNCPYYVKLRPGVQDFLASASKKYNIVLYTMGFKKYAEEVRLLMDPTGHYIKAVISREDHNARRGEDGKKSIQEFIPLYDANTVIIDDIIKVWEKPDNVLEVPRYAFWPDNENDIKAYHEVEDHAKVWTPEVLIKKEKDYTLQNITHILNTVHEVWYSTRTPKFSAPRIIDKLAQGVLAGCEIVFTGVIPVQRDHREHEYWKMAKKFGATCSKHVTERTTHVIAGKRVTEKVQQARKSPGLSVVHYNWLLQSCAQFVRAEEEEFKFRRPPSPPPPRKCHASKEMDLESVKKNSGLLKILADNRQAAD